MPVLLFGQNKAAIRKWLTWTLGVQAAIAIFLIATDAEQRLRLNLTLDAGPTTGPVSPGDQVRRYEPFRTTPKFSNPVMRPPIELAADYPSRLEFSLQQNTDLGAVLVMNGPIEKGDACVIRGHSPTESESMRPPNPILFARGFRAIRPPL